MDVESLTELYVQKWLSQMKRLGKHVTPEGLEGYRKAARLMAEIAVLSGEGRRRGSKKNP
jgi:hypothetical protein